MTHQEFLRLLHRAEEDLIAGGLLELIAVHHLAEIVPEGCSEQE
jgi:hypothetical protein